MKVNRPGVDPKWMSYFRVQSGFIEQTRDELEAAASLELSSYAQDGVAQAALKRRPAPQVTPPFKNWESVIPGYLISYANKRIYALQSIGSNDSNLSAAAFASAYTGELINYYSHRVFSSRFPGRQLRMMNQKVVAHTALGVVTGATGEAFRLARLQIDAYRNQYYFDLDHYPIFAFMLRLLADHLQEGQLNLIGEPAEEPIFRTLFDRWREPDAGSLAELCLAACDAHMRRCAPAKNGQFHEFDSGAFMLIPIEILLLFKLRQSLGLANPVLDHPMMDTPLGQLPREVGFRPDDLIARVRARMHRDGFDEEAIASLERAAPVE